MTLLFQILSLISMSLVLFSGRYEIRNADALPVGGIGYLYMIVCILGLMMTVGLQIGRQNQISYYQSNKGYWVLLETMLSLVSIVMISSMSFLWMKLVGLEVPQSVYPKVSLGLLGLCIYRVWSTEEKADTIQSIWNKLNKDYVDEMSRRFKKLVEFIELPEEVMERMLTLGNPYDTVLKSVNKRKQ